MQAAKEEAMRQQKMQNKLALATRLRSNIFDSEDFSPSNGNPVFESDFEAVEAKTDIFEDEG